MRVLPALALLVALTPSPARAAPDPTLATILSASSTLLPIGVAATLWGTGRGVEEGIRFDVGMSFLGVGAIAGPSIGQFYAGGGTNAVVSLVLRALTGAVMLTGSGLWVRGDEDAQEVGTALSFIGGVPTALLAVYDIVDASSTALETRRKAATALVEPLPAIDVGGFSLCAATAAWAGCAPLR